MAPPPLLVRNMFARSEIGREREHLVGLFSKNSIIILTHEKRVKRFFNFKHSPSSSQDL